MLLKHVNIKLEQSACCEQPSLVAEDRKDFQAFTCRSCGGFQVFINKLVVWRYGYSVKEYCGTKLVWIGEPTQLLEDEAEVRK